MELKARYIKALTDENGNIEVTFSTKDRNAIQDLRNKFKEQELRLKVSKHNDKRSIDANAYYWVLAQKLANKLSEKGAKPITATEIYREHIKDVGAYLITPICEREIERWVRIWTDRGTGWICEDMGECRTKAGYHNIKCYYGSSMYDKQQMERLINLMIADCKECGVETRTPNELIEMISLWETAQ